MQGKRKTISKRIVMRKPQKRREKSKKNWKGGWWYWWWCVYCSTFLFDDRIILLPSVWVSYFSDISIFYINNEWPVDSALLLLSWQASNIKLYKKRCLLCCVLQFGRSQIAIDGKKKKKTAKTWRWLYIFQVSIGHYVSAQIRPLTLTHM